MRRSTTRRSSDSRTSTSPKLIVAGASAYSLVIDWKRFREIADSVGAHLMVDMAHYAGLVAAGLYPSPIKHAHFVTSTTHKTLRGPRGGLILGHAENEKPINSAIFPGGQGGPLMHVIAAKAVAFKEAMAPEFRDYQEQVIDNARVMAKVLQERGLRIVSGRTDCHMFLVDLRAKKITGKDAETVLGPRAHDGEQERHPQRSGEAVRHQRHPHRLAGDDDARVPGAGGRAARQSDRRRAGCAAGRQGHRARGGGGQAAVRAVSGVRLSLTAEARRRRANR